MPKPSQIRSTLSEYGSFFRIMNLRVLSYHIRLAFTFLFRLLGGLGYTDTLGKSRNSSLGDISQIGSVSSDFLGNTLHDLSGILLEDGLRLAALLDSLLREHDGAAIGDEIYGFCVSDSGEFVGVLASQVARLSTKDCAVQALAHEAVAALDAFPNKLRRSHFAVYLSVVRKEKRIVLLVLQLLETDYVTHSSHFDS